MKRFTDYINDNLKRRKLRDYQLSVQNGMISGNESMVFDLILTTYNKIAKEPVGREWIDNLHARQLLWFEKYGDRETIQLKDEFKEVA
jgi:hypothetical protein